MVAGKALLDFEAKVEAVELVGDLKLELVEDNIDKPVAELVELALEPVKEPVAELLMLALEPVIKPVGVGSFEDQVM